MKGDLQCPGPTGFTIAPDGRSITFSPCGVTSHHPMDVQERYCGRCHCFYLDWPAELTPAGPRDNVQPKTETAMTTIDELERRVTALEAAQKHTAETQEWMASTLGRIAAVQDRHTATLAEHTQRLDRIEGEVREVKADLKGLRSDLPAMLAAAVREGLKPSSD